MGEKPRDNEGEEFLNKTYSDLANSPEVESAAQREELLLGEEKAKKKEEKIHAYLNRLAEIFDIEDEEKKERLVDFLKDKLHERFVIKEDGIPEIHFENLKRIARERGQGDVEITPEARKVEADLIIKDQEKSLDDWVDYLGSDDAPYPDWLKYWALRNVVNMNRGKKNKDGKVVFTDRVFAKFDKDGALKNKSTTAPFPEINREALAYVLGAVEKQQKEKSEKKHGKKVEEVPVVQPTDEQWEKLLTSQNFSKLYAHAIETMTPASQEERENIDGTWEPFGQLTGDKAKDDETIKNLYTSLEGRGTGWCTANETTARNQLTEGDFYVFYTKDGNGGYKIPRVAIRMSGGEIAEVRGINADQNLEPVMVDVAKEKYSSLPGGDKYEKRAGDMERLTKIEKKVTDKANGLEKEIEEALPKFNAANPDWPFEDVSKSALEEQGFIDIKAKLTKEELKFLYEVDNKIEGFGYRDDPRIRSIKGYRDKKRDCATMLDCTPDQITSDILSCDENTKIFTPIEYNPHSAIRLSADDRHVMQLYHKSFTRAEELTPEDLAFIYRDRRNWDTHPEFENIKSDKIIGRRKDKGSDVLVVSKYILENSGKGFYPDEIEKATNTIALDVIEGKAKEMEKIKELLSTKNKDNDFNEFFDEQVPREETIGLKKEIQELEVEAKRFELTKEELELLYEVNGKIEVFSDNKDLRIRKLLGEREAVKDLSVIFGLELTHEQIAYSQGAINDKTVIFINHDGVDRGGAYQKVEKTNNGWIFQNPHSGRKKRFQMAENAVYELIERTVDDERPE